MKAYPTLGLSVTVKNKKDYYNFRKAQEKVNPSIPRFSTDEYERYAHLIGGHVIIRTEPIFPSFGRVMKLFKYDRMFKRYGVKHKLCVQWVDY